MSAFLPLRKRGPGGISFPKMVQPATPAIYEIINYSS